MQTRHLLTGLCLAASLALLTGLVLWFDNPTVNVGASDITDRGPAGKVACSIAPWDAGLNGNDDGPGGDHTSAFRDEVAAACHAANTKRFRASVGSGALAVVLLAAAAVMGPRTRRVSPSSVA